MEEKFVNRWSEMKFVDVKGDFHGNVGTKKKKGIPSPHLSYSITLIIWKYFIKRIEIQMKFQLNRKNRRKEEENLSRRNQEESKDFNENGNQLTISSLSSDRTHFKTNEIPYLECQFAVFTPSLSQCNIGELIKQPEGVDQNEWIAIHSLYYISFSS